MSQSINLYNLLAKKKQFKKTVNFDLKRIELIEEILTNNKLNGLNVTIL